MKRLGYILIPVLAILLMSHNTFALDNTYDPVTCFNDTGTGQVTCTAAPYYTGNVVNVISVSRANNGWGLGQQTNTFIWAIRIKTTGNYPISINLSNGYPEMTNIHDIAQDCQATANGTTCNVLVSGTIRQSDFNIQLAGMVSANGVNYDIKSTYFATQYSDGTFGRDIYGTLNTLLNFLRNNPTASAQDIADAVNGQQQSAGEAQSQAGDTAASDSETAVDNATQSLFSAMGTVVSALRDTPASDCLITVSSVGSSQVFTSAIGQLNVCSVPSGILAIVQGLAALVIVPMVLMACYSLLHKIYNAFKEVQDT